MLHEEEIGTHKNRYDNNKKCPDEGESLQDISEQTAINEFSENSGDVNEAKKKALRKIMLNICLSGVMLSFALFYEAEKPVQTNLEIFIGFFILYLFLTIQLFRIKFYCEEEHKIWVRISMLFLLLWFGFNVVFYFSWKLIPPAIILVYPGFQFRCSKILDLLGIKLRPKQSTVSWFINRIGFLRKLRDYYSDDEMTYLVFLGFISLLCLFMIMGAYWSAAILTFFLIITQYSIVTYNPYKGILYRRFLDGHPSVKSNPIPFKFRRDILNPLELFHILGTTGFAFAFIYSDQRIKLPLSLQLSIWGACCWNFIMSEIYIYAVNV